MAAEPFFRQAVAQAENAGEPLPLARCLHYLGLTLRAQGRFDQALAVHRRAVGTLEQVSRREPGFELNVAQAIQSLAALLIAVNRPQEAEPLLRRALLLAGKDPYTRSLVLNSLGELYYRTGRDAEAQERLRQALQANSELDGARPDEEILAQTLTLSHAYTLLRAWTSNNAGLVAYRAGLMDEAERHWRRSIDLFSAVGLAGGAAIGGPLANLGDLFRQKKRYSEAMEFVTKALEVYDLAFGSNSARSASVLHLLGDLLISLGENSQARSTLARSLEITKRTLGAGSSQAGLVLTSMAELEYREGNLVRAEQLYLEGIRILELAEGPDHPALHAPLAGYAQVLRKLKRSSEAKALDARRTNIRILARSGSDSLVSFRDLQNEKATRK